MDLFVRSEVVWPLPSRPRSSSMESWSSPKTGKRKARGENEKKQKEKKEKNKGFKVSWFKLNGLKMVFGTWV